MSSRTDPIHEVRHDPLQLAILTSVEQNRRLRWDGSFVESGVKILVLVAILGSCVLEAQITLSGVSHVQIIVDSLLYHTELLSKYYLFGGDTSCKLSHLRPGNHSAQAEAYDVTLLGQSEVLNLVEGSRDITTAPADPSPVSITASVTTVPLWSVYEVAMNSATSYSNAYTGVSVTATFTGPNGTTKYVKGFWDGGNSFRLRFTPTIRGVWTYSIGSQPTDAGLARSGTLNVTGPKPGEHGFLRRDPSSVYNFRFDDGTHYFMMGQTYYNIILNLNGGGDWKTAIANSRAYGFSKVRILLYSWGAVAPYSDIVPFIGTASNSNKDQLNVVFWQEFDQLVSYVKSQGMIADLILFNDGSYSYGTTTQNKRYIEYALARVGGYTNVIWCVSNEYNNVPATGEIDTEKAALANGFTDGSGYYAADAQMKFLGDTLHDADPYFLSDSLSQAPRPLSAHQHTQVGFLGFELGATSLHPTWFSHAIIQYGPRNSVTSNGDQWGNSGSQNNYGRKLPVVNDEYGYIDPSNAYHLKDGTRFTQTRAVLRNAIWGIVTGGGFGTLGGDTTVVGACSSGPIFCGNWLDQPDYYGDIKIMTRFVSTLPFWQMAPANRVSGARAYAWGRAGDFVIYAAAGGTVIFNGLSPTLCNVVRLDPRTGTTKSLGTETGSFPLVSPDSQDYVYHLTGSRCR